MIDFTEPEFIEPDPIDPLDCGWPAPPEPDGPSWWFNPEEPLSDTEALARQHDAANRWWLF